MKFVPFELLERMPHYFEYLSKYRTLCTRKYDWWVRLDLGLDYYVNGERPIVDDAEVFNCNWTPEKWNLEPYVYIRRQGNEIIKYAREGLEPLDKYSYGWKREDSKVVKNGEVIYYGLFRSGDVSAHYFVDSGDIWVVWGSSHTNYYGASGTHTQGALFSQVKPIKKPLNEPVMKAAIKLNAQKNKGFYKPFVDRLVELYDLNRSQI